LPKKITSLAKNIIPLEGICLDRLLKQRSALREPEIPFGFPPQRGGLRSLSGRAVCIAAENASVFRTLIQSPTNSWPWPNPSI
jgi:hypothetical protein